MQADQRKKCFPQRAHQSRVGLAASQVRACTSNQAFERDLSYPRNGAKKKTITLWVGMDIKGLALISVYI